MYGFVLHFVRDQMLGDLSWTIRTIIQCRKQWNTLHCLTCWFLLVIPWWWSLWHHSEPDSLHVLSGRLSLSNAYNAKLKMTSASAALCPNVGSEPGWITFPQNFILWQDRIFLITTILTLPPPLLLRLPLRFAVIASGCASCPRLVCRREGCGAEFCYHCKQAWHPNQTCDSARQQRAQSLHTHSNHSPSYTQEHGAGENQ